MDQTPTLVLVLLICLLFGTVNSEENDVKQSLVQFFHQLSSGNVKEGWGWTMNSDPCTDNWLGVSCDLRSKFVRKIILDHLNLTGVLDAAALCKTRHLAVLSLRNNNVVGVLPAEIGNCTSLIHLNLGKNQFSGSLPWSLSYLNNLKRIYVPDNNFSGQIPVGLCRISGLISFLAENNKLAGRIPNFDFSNLVQFNVSNNNLSGQIPDGVKGQFPASSFAGNSGLCGEPLLNACPPASSPVAQPPFESSF